MNLTSLNRSRRSIRKLRAAFTLIELLVVIAIIGILAALIVGGAGIAQAKSRRARVEAEREQLISIIEAYKKAKGYYPPDNSNTPNPFPGAYTYQNTLFFELTGCDIQGNPAAPPFLYRSRVSGEIFTNGDIMLSFNVGGILNASTDTNEVVNYFKNLRAGQHGLIKAPSGAVFSVLGVGVPGPGATNTVGGTGPGILNPWNYVLTNPTNNPGSFDLWMDVYWSGKTNRVCNWSRDPIVL